MVEEVVEFLSNYAKNLAEELKGKTLGEFAREKGCRVEDVLEKKSTHLGMLGL